MGRGEILEKREFSVGKGQIKFQQFFEEDFTVNLICFKELQWKWPIQIFDLEFNRLKRQMVLSRNDGF